MWVGGGLSERSKPFVFSSKPMCLWDIVCICIAILDTYLSGAARRPFFAGTRPHRSHVVLCKAHKKIVVCTIPFLYENTVG